MLWACSSLFLLFCFFSLLGLRTTSWNKISGIILDWPGCTQSGKVGIVASTKSVCRCIHAWLLEIWLWISYPSSFLHPQSLFEFVSSYRIPSRLGRTGRLIGNSKRNDRQIIMCQHFDRAVTRFQLCAGLGQIRETFTTALWFVTSFRWRRRCANCEQDYQATTEWQDLCDIGPGGAGQAFQEASRSEEAKAAAIERLRF